MGTIYTKIPEQPPAERFIDTLDKYVEQKILLESIGRTVHAKEHVKEAVQLKTSELRAELAVQLAILLAK